MLAYVFWHWPFREIEQDRYESSLFDFHRSLVERKPDGFQESYVFRLKETPWGSNDGLVYEDWYLVDDFQALSLLNDGAVTGVSRAPHDRIAQKSRRWRGRRVSSSRRSARPVAGTARGLVFETERFAL